MLRGKFGYTPVAVESSRAAVRYQCHEGVLYVTPKRPHSRANASLVTTRSGIKAVRG